MAQRRAQREDDDAQLPIQAAAAPPSLLSLPDVAHGIIASFLLHDDDNDSPLRVSEASRALLKSYGGSLTRMRLHFVEGSSADRLCALLQRQEKLAEVTVWEAEQAIPPFCQAVVEGCCQKLEKFDFGLGSGRRNFEMSQEYLSLLTEAMGSDGALPALRTFSFYSLHTRNVLSRLAEALVGGTLPNLREMSINTCYDRNELECLADMLEARARIPGCKGLERFEGRSGRRPWFDETSLATQVRLLRVLLPSLKELPRFSCWKVAYNQ